MSKLPVISGAECIKVLGKNSFVVNRQRGSHVILVREEPKTTISVP
jgi:predicted RNA binding protein YcfA (HicA-like mRNA interferase family)